MTSEDRVRGPEGKFIPTLATAERIAEAARLRAQGFSYQKIADEMGTDKTTAFRDVQNAMKAVIVPAGEEAVAQALGLLDEELIRLDWLYEQTVAVLERNHVTVSQGRVVYDENDLAVPDDDWILKAVDRLVRIDDSRRKNSESRRRLLGIDQPAKTQISGGVTYEVVGVDPELLK